MSALTYWVWLASCPHVSAGCQRALLEHFGSAEEVYYAEAGALAQVEGVGEDQVRALENKSLDAAEAILEACAAKDIFVLTQQDALYPQRLGNIFDPPLLLYGRGSMPMFDSEMAVSVVGTRNCTPYGLRMAEQFGYGLGRQGAIVVSGLARGIDGAAHRGALRSGGFTAAVLGCGVDVVYPVSNRRLYEDILSSGVILSEYPPGTEPAPWRFPARNRIISGLTLATLVVEAPEKSGALITAATALEQGRDVFAVPGPLDSPHSLGCNRLIRDGAGLAMDSWDLLRAYSGRYPHKLHPEEETLPPLPRESRQEKPGETVSAEPLSAEPEKPALPVLDLEKDGEKFTRAQIAVLRILDDKKPMLIDDLAARTDIPMRQILSAVTMLEIDGLIRQEGMRMFLRTVEVSETKE